MRTNGQTPAVIFSLKDGESALEALRRVAKHDLHVKVGTGCYNGQEEVAFHIPLTEFTDEVKAFILRDGQEAVMLLDNQYNAFLSLARNSFPGYNTGLAHYIGELRAVSDGHARKLSAWSKFGDQYYVASK